MYSFVNKEIDIFDNPYRTLPDSYPSTLYGFIELDNDYFAYTGNSSDYYSVDYHIVRISGDFELAEDFVGVFSIFEANDGSTFLERNFTFGYADNGIWVASDSIVRKYSSTGESIAIYVQ